MKPFVLRFWIACAVLGAGIAAGFRLAPSGLASPADLLSLVGASTAIVLAGVAAIVVEDLWHAVSKDPVR